MPRPYLNKKEDFMAEFLCNRAIQVFGQVYPENSIIIINSAEVKEEIAKGVNPKTKNPLSAFFNHCSPVDKEAEDAFAQFFADKEKPAHTEKPKEVDEKVEMAKLKKELDDLKIDYDRRWGADRLREELIKAKKKRGL
mgnify:CR=1 FL=1